MDIIKHTQPIAKKNHSCGYCGFNIAPGEKYDYFVIRHDDFYVWKNHINCKILAEKLNLFKEAHPEGVNDEFFYESIIEKYKDITGDRKPEESWEYVFNKVKNHFKLC